MRQPSEFSVARFRVMNISIYYIDQAYKEKSNVVFLGGEEIDRLFRKQPAPSYFHLCDIKGHIYYLM